MRSWFYTSRNVHNIPIFNLKHSLFKNSFFPSSISEWNKVNLGLHNSESLSIFRKNILEVIKPVPNSFYNCHNPKGIKLIKQLWIGLSHLGQHKFKHDFQVPINLYVIVVMILNQQIMFFSTAPYSLIKESLSSAL